MYDPDDLPSRSIRISPRSRLDLSIRNPVSPTVLRDICFLAQQHGEFYLCESPNIMEVAIYDRYPNWQQRWAAMLTTFEKRREFKEWVDMVPPKLEERKAKSGMCCLIPSLELTTAPSRLPQPRRVQGLREIHLSPVVSGRNPTQLTPQPLPPKLPRKIPVQQSPRNRTKAHRDRTVKNDENKPPQTPKMITVAAGIGAAVGGDVRKVVGRSGFGRPRVDSDVSWTLHDLISQADIWKHYTDTICSWYGQHTYKGPKARREPALQARQASADSARAESKEDGVWVRDRYRGMTDMAVPRRANAPHLPRRRSKASSTYSQVRPPLTSRTRHQRPPPTQQAGDRGARVACATPNIPSWATTARRPPTPYGATAPRLLNTGQELYIDDTNHPYCASPTIAYRDTSIMSFLLLVILSFRLFTAGIAMQGIKHVR